MTIPSKEKLCEAQSAAEDEDRKLEQLEEISDFMKQKIKQLEEFKRCRITWDFEDAELLSWDDPPHQGNYKVYGDDGNGNLFVGTAIIVFHDLPDMEIIDVEDIEQITD